MGISFLKSLPGTTDAKQTINSPNFSLSVQACTRPLILIEQAVSKCSNLLICYQKRLPDFLPIVFNLI